MTKLIFTSRYLKDAKPSQKENYVHYIGTRKGVEKIDTSKKHLPATVSQKKLVHQLLQDFPATKEMLEYEDYQRKPTIENASEFIFCALEQNLDIAATRKNYVDYLAHRPRVEKIGEHGLFTDEGEAREIPKLMKQLLLEEQSEQGEISDSAKPFFASEKEKLAFEKRHSHHPPEWKLPEKGETVRAYLGIDSGSTTTKFALIDEREEILGSFYAPNEGDPLTVAKTALIDMRERLQTGRRRSADSGSRNYRIWRNAVCKGI